MSQTSNCLTISTVSLFMMMMMMMVRMIVHVCLQEWWIPCFWLPRATMSDRKPVIKNADMSEDMQQDAVECATQALEKYNIEKDIAAYIKKVKPSPLSGGEKNSFMKDKTWPTLLLSVHFIVVIWLSKKFLIPTFIFALMFHNHHPEICRSSFYGTYCAKLTFLCF